MKKIISIIISLSIVLLSIPGIYALFINNKDSIPLSIEVSSTSSHEVLELDPKYYDENYSPFEGGTLETDDIEVEVINKEIRIPVANSGDRYVKKSEGSSQFNNGNFAGNVNNNPMAPGPSGPVIRPDGKTFNVYNVATDKVEAVDMKEYVVAVVAAEMGATAKPEALKAQAVAAYTYAIRKKELLKTNASIGSKHNGAEICTSPSHCLAFLSRERAKEKWGADWFNKYFSNIDNAVDAVIGEAMFYDNKLANTVFHSISGGITENAKDVWGSFIPYLVSVDSSVDKTAKGYETVRTYTKAEFENLLKGKYGNKFTKYEISNITRSNAGGVMTLQVDDVIIKGEAFRQLFKMRSTDFKIDIKDNNYIFTVHGYGHGVGMSQNGAKELANQGKNYHEILSHYFNGISFGYFVGN